MCGSLTDGCKSGKREKSGDSEPAPRHAGQVGRRRKINLSPFGCAPYAISLAHTADASTLPERSVENGEPFSTRYFQATSLLMKQIQIFIRTIRIENFNLGKYDFRPPSIQTPFIVFTADASMYTAVLKKARFVSYDTA